jgi:hypothetical protein
MRPPVVVGVGGGVGTTTLALALRGRDGEHTGHADVLVCRATVDSLRRAAAVLERSGPGPRPVLAVTLDGARLPRGPVRARLRTLEPQANAVVLLPHVRMWRTVDDPSAQAVTLLVAPVEHVPWALQAYATAVHDLAAAVVASGRLQTAPERSDAAGAPAQAASRTAAGVGDAARRSAPGAAVVPRVVGTFRPAVASSGAAAPQRGIRILNGATPPGPVRRPVVPVRSSPGRRILPGGTPGPDERAEQAG